MLHEVLLALSGHPSPLFTDGQNKSQDDDLPLLSPSERALLQSIGELSELHRKLRRHIEEITSSHPSTICRAVATSVQQTHLARFQRKVLDVESKILTKDPSIVGAYDIVPLAGVVAEFDDWHRRLAWYWQIACFVRPEHGTEFKPCSGPALIDKLRTEQQTGFPEVEAAAVELSRVAETAWLRQLSSWILYGKVPGFGADDFFVDARMGQEPGSTTFSRRKDLLPQYVTAPTAASILFIGKSLHQVQRYGRRALSSGNSAAVGMSEQDLAAVHLKHLTTLAMPIVSAQLSRTVSTIRLSLSQNVLQHLLPMELTLQMFSSLRSYFLLGSGEFATTLINEAESRVQARQQSMGRLLQQDPVKALQGLSIKDAELQQTLSAVWKALAARDEDDEDDILDFARTRILLKPPRQRGSRPSTADSSHDLGPAISHVSFQDLLFPIAARLILGITQPLDLIISQEEIESYAAINAYLLVVRRAILRLSDLWRKTIARRDYPTPLAQPKGTSTEQKTRRSRIMKRSVATRKIWATCSAGLFLLSETSAYFEGEIVRESWAQFEAWVKAPASSAPNDNDDSGVETEDSMHGSTAQKDPETLASGHRVFLASLVYALLLNDVAYTRDLRSLLGNIDNLIAFFNRLLDIQQKLDLKNDSGGETGYTTEEEQRISLELDRARKRVDSDLKAVISRLRQLDQERIGSGRYLDQARSESGFEAWKGGGVDRLLMKLEYGRMADEGYDIV